MKYSIYETNCSKQQFKSGSYCSDRTSKKFDTLEEARKEFENKKIDHYKEASPIFWKNGIHMTEIICEDEEGNYIESCDYYVEDKNGEY